MAEGKGHATQQTKDKYFAGTSMRDIFATQSVGIVTGHDDDVIDFDDEALKKKIKKKYNSFDQTNIKTVAYRPFDNRRLYYNKDTIGRTRENVMQHMLKPNVGFCFTRKVNGEFFHCFTSRFITESSFVSSKTSEICSIAPLWVYYTAKDEAKEAKAGGKSDNWDVDEKQHNFKHDFWKMVVGKFGAVLPEAVFGYIYAVLHSSTYRTKYLEFLKIDFPRIPFDCDLVTFNKLAEIGNQLIDAHLLKFAAQLPIGETLPNNHLREIAQLQLGDAKTDDDVANVDYFVSKVEYNAEKQRLYFNKTSYFDNVLQEVWSFKIGGYQVLDKWLKSRKSMNIANDLEHVANIVKSLAFTLQKMQEIDCIANDCNIF